MSPSASDMPSHTAKGDTSVSRIKVRPTKNDSDPTVKFPDNNDAVLTDTGTPGFDVDMDVRENTSKVELTAEDGTTMQTYTVTATRVELSVRNLGEFGLCSASFLEAAAQLTAGRQTRG